MLRASKTVLLNAGEAQSGDVDWAEYNRQLRTRVVAWARSKPANAVMILMASMTPCMQLLSELLKKSGSQWEQLQQRLAAERGERTYIALEASKQTALQTFFVALTQIFKAAMPYLYPSGLLRKYQVRLVQSPVL